MNFYVPEMILTDYERSAQMRLDRATEGMTPMVQIHANVLLGLIHSYREARERDIQSQR